MPLEINYKNSISKKNQSNLILFVDEKFTISPLKNHVSSSEYLFLSDLIKSKDQKEKNTHI